MPPKKTGVKPSTKPPSANADPPPPSEAPAAVVVTDGAVAAEIESLWLTADGAPVFRLKLDSQRMTRSVDVPLDDMRRLAPQLLIDYLLSRTEPPPQWHEAPPTRLAALLPGQVEMLRLRKRARD